jgi:phosphate acetyltransferase
MSQPNSIIVIRQAAANRNRTIVLPETWDARTIEAAHEILKNALAKLILIPSPGMEISPLMQQALGDGRLMLVSPEEDASLKKYAAALYEKRKAKGMTEVQALQFVSQPVNFAAALVNDGRADGCVAGAATTTADVLRAAISIIGLKKGSNVVSSTFLMSMQDGRVFTFGDCAVVPYPTSEQLASIAIDSAETHHSLTGTVPKVAMLSFSTKGSATHPNVELVRKAVEIAKNLRPDLALDGELQFDAALLPAIGARKAPGSPVAGEANVFVFPNLDAGNIGYKIAERLGGATATGPIIQGLAKPMNDLSRGCSANDIVDTVCVCALMS